MQGIRTMRVGVYALALMAMAHVAPADADAGSPYYSYYFKEKRPLTLDVSRLAIFHGDVARHEDVLLALGEQGFAEDSLQPWPIHGWSIAFTPMNVRRPEALEQVAAQLAQAEAIQFVSPVFLDEYGGPIIPTRDIFVAFGEDVPAARAEAILAASGAGAVIARNYAQMAGVFRLRSTAGSGFDVLAAANSLAERDDVKFAEVDMIATGYKDLIPNDPSFDDLWGLNNAGQDVICTGGSATGVPDIDLDAPEAWNITTGGANVIVVLMDDGVQQDHPDIHQAPGTDVTDDPGSLHDGGPVNSFDNHGTTVAGCVSARINNFMGVVGVAPGCRVASVRFNISTETSFTFEFSWFVDGLSWAQSINARVTNCSGHFSPVAIITQKYADTHAAGMIHFASAGNTGAPVLGYPASLPTVNAVAAINRDGTLATTSSWGAGLDFAAPGTQIKTTDRTGADGFGPDDYVCQWGTSYASPFTAGVAALMLSANPSLTAPEVESILQQTSTDLGASGYDTHFGWGLPNALRAIQASVSSAADLNHDGHVSSTDLGILLAAWSIPATAAACGGAQPCPVDINGDGVVNMIDLGILLSNWTLM